MAVVRLEKVGEVVDKAENVDGGKRKRDRKGGLPGDPPVQPLGCNGGVYYYLDAQKQLRPLTAREHAKNTIGSLVAPHHQYLRDHWPSYGKDGNVKDWEASRAVEAFMAAAARCGIWDGADRERSVGAWRGDCGELVVHFGDAVVVVDRETGEERWYEPGLIGEYVYPAKAPLMRPWPEAVPAGDQGPVGEVLALLRRWQWRRPQLDPRLMLGFIGAAMIGGALSWRPSVWFTGPRGAGKSTVHDMMKLLLGTNGCVSTSDASAAGLWQLLGRSTLPVFYDEIENEANDEKMQAVIRLARQAASGGVILRGGAEHKGSRFEARSCFGFSSILIPSLLGQDASRLAILDMENLPQDVSAPSLEPEKFQTFGQQFRRRLIDGWPRMERTFGWYWDSLKAMGHTARSADQYGMLLACAHLLLDDELPDGEVIDEGLQELQPEALAEVQDAEPDEHQCLMHLLTSMIDPWRNGRRNTVGVWLVRALEPSTTDGEWCEANRALGMYGLRLLGEQRAPAGLAVANQHQGLAPLFDGTRWAGRPGTKGVWVQALRRLPDARASEGTVYLGGVSVRCTIVPWPVVERVLARGAE